MWSLWWCHVMRGLHHHWRPTVPAGYERQSRLGWGHRWIMAAQYKQVSYRLFKHDAASRVLNWWHNM